MGLVNSLQRDLEDGLRAHQFRLGSDPGSIVMECKIDGIYNIHKRVEFIFRCRVGSLDGRIWLEKTITGTSAEIGFWDALAKAYIAAYQDILRRLLSDQEIMDALLGQPVNESPTN